MNDATIRRITDVRVDQFDNVSALSNIEGEGMLVMKLTRYREHQLTLGLELYPEPMRYEGPGLPLGATSFPPAPA